MWPGAASGAVDPWRVASLCVPAPPLSLTRPMRGRRRTIAAVLTDALAPRPEARAAALAAAFSDACGQRIAREASYRGLLQDGRLLVLVRTAAWAEQLAKLEPDICARIEARLGRGTAPGLHIRVHEPR